MKLSRRRLLTQITASGVVIGVCGGSKAVARSNLVSPGPEINAKAFQQSIGVTAHWDYQDTVYGRHTDKLIADIARLGIRHVRGYDPEVSAKLARQGVYSMLVSGPEVGSPQQIANLLLKANQHNVIIDAVEGPNEADLFWPLHHYSYEGQGFPAGVLAYQRDLFAAVRARQKLNDIVVVGPSLGHTYDPGASHDNPFPPHSLTNAVTWGNFHPYSFGGNPFSLPFPYDTIARYYWHGNFPSVNLDEYPYAFDVYAPPFAPKPMAATETGYSTWRNGVSEEVQAKYIPRLMAEYVRLGVRRTYLYELADVVPDPSGADMSNHFGLIRNDLTVKPAYAALQSLLALTSPNGSVERGSAGPALRLSAHLPPGFDRPNYVHSLVVRRSAEEAVLLVWHEVASADTSTSPPRTIMVPAGAVGVATTPPWKIAAWFDYDITWQFRRHNIKNEAAKSGDVVSVPLRDQLVAVLLKHS